MVKLIRISSTDENAIFNANFDTNINLKSNASIAVKNAVFNYNREIGAIDNKSGAIISQPCSTDPVNTLANQLVRVGRYTSDQFREFMNEIELALNRSLSISDGFVPNKGDRAHITSMYNVKIADNDKINISYALSPVMDIFYQDAFAPQPAAGASITHSVVGGVRDVIGCNVGNITTEQLRLVSQPGVELSKGSGLFFAQIFDSQNTGTPAQNGFGIGFSIQEQNDNGTTATSTNPRRKTNTLQHHARSFEIDYQDSTQNYRFRAHGFKPAVDNQQDAGFSSVNSTQANITKNDIVMLKIDTDQATKKKVVSGHVLQYNGVGNATDRQLFSYELTDNDLALDVNGKPKIFTPYLYLRGSQTNIRLCNVRFTPNPHNRPLSAGDELDDPFYPTEDDYRIEDQIEPELKDLLPGIDANRFDPSITNKITFDTELLDILGKKSKDDSTDVRVLQKTFDNLGDIGPEDVFGDDLNIGLLIASYDMLNIPLFTGQDFFLIEALNLNVDSYNSSNPNFELRVKNNVGERKNILDTIPVDDSLGIVSYQPNEMTFIDIKNSEDVNLRNLKVRIVNEDIQPIRTIGKSHITLLVKD